MSLSFISHSLFLILAVFLTALWVNQPSLSLYTLQLIAFFILLYFVNRQLVKSKNKDYFSSIILTLVILLLVSSTGNAGSPLFFLIYFLLFGLSLTLEPSIVAILSFILIIFFFLINGKQALEHILPIFSLLLITPLALFFGRQYLQVLKQKGLIKILKKKQNQAETNITKEETNSLMWLNLNFNYAMIKTIDLVSQVLARARISFSERQNLTEVLRINKKLFQTGKLLKEKIDQQTDNN